MHENTTIAVVLGLGMALVALMVVEIRGCDVAKNDAVNKTAQTCITAGRSSADCQAIIQALPR